MQQLPVKYKVLVETLFILLFVKDTLYTFASCA